MSGPNQRSTGRIYLAAALLVVNAGLIVANLAKQDVLPSFGLFGGAEEATPADTAADGGTSPTTGSTPTDTAGGEGSDDPAAPVATTPQTAPQTASQTPVDTVDDWPGGRGPVPEGPPVVRRATFTDTGRLQLTGSAPDWATASRVVQFAAEKLPGGAAQIDNLLSWHPDASTDPQWGEVAFEQAATFAASGSEIDPASLPALDLVAQILVAHPTVFAVVIGHADTSGDEQANITLTASRADAVISYLVGAGVNGGQLVVAAAGEDDPLADNATVEGREANRRVEIRLKNFLIADPTLGGSG